MHQLLERYSFVREQIQAEIPQKLHTVCIAEKSGSDTRVRRPSQVRAQLGANDLEGLGGFRVRLDARRPGGSVRGERANLTGLVLSCIDEAKFCTNICVGISV